MAQLIAMQDSYIAQFLNFADEHAKDAYEEGIKDPVIQDVNHVRDVALGHNQSNEIINPQRWFDMMTKKIGVMLHIEEEIAQDVLSVAHEDMKLAEHSRNVSILIVIALLVIVALCSYVVLRDLLSSIRGTEEVMDELGNGNLSVAVRGVERKDEIGTMARAIEIFKTKLIENKQLEEATLKNQARAEEEKRKVMQDLASSFENRVQGIISGVAAAATELSHTAELMSQSTTESNNNAGQAVAASDDTYVSIQSVAAASEEMAATIQEISSQMQNTSRLVTQSVERVNGADKYAGELQQTSGEVREVIQLISNIARQINLLALNATIESARAGEAGKGFAVVANEVRNLAAQTDKSIQDIEKVIGSMSQASDGVVSALDGIKTSVEQIQAAATGVASAVEEQSVVVNDISQNMSTAQGKTEVVRNNIGMVSRSSNEASQNAQQVLLAAQELSKQSEQLDEEVQTFLSEVRGS